MKNSILRFRDSQVVDTYTATIFVGLREGYNGFEHSMFEVEDICQDYVDDHGLCVTVDETLYIYTHGREPGARIGLINYPRFPKDSYQILDHAVTLADILVRKLGQYRCTIVCSDHTFMIVNDTVNRGGLL